MTDGQLYVPGERYYASVSRGCEVDEAPNRTVQCSGCGTPIEEPANLEDSEPQRKSHNLWT
jgi:hypothetical protein